MLFHLPENKLIQCGKLESGEVCFGELKEIGLSDEPKNKIVKVKTKSGDIVEGEII